jgi:hypothetical protein
MENYLVHVAWTLHCFDDIEIAAESEADAVTQAAALHRFSWDRCEVESVRAFVLEPGEPQGD